MDDSKMTELERKWAEVSEDEEERKKQLLEEMMNELDSGEEDHECCGGCGGGGCCSSEEEQSDSLGDDWIKHPFSDSFVPLGLVESGMKTYICGISDMDDQTNTCFVLHPLLFQEQLVMTDHDPNGPPQLQIQMRLPYISLGTMELMSLSYDAVYLFQNNKEEDMRLASAYENNYLRSRASASNLIAPSSEDIMKANSGK